MVVLKPALPGHLVQQLLALSEPQAVHQLHLVTAVDPARFFLDWPFVFYFFLAHCVQMYTTFALLDIGRMPVTLPAPAASCRHAPQGRAARPRPPRGACCCRYNLYGPWHRPYTNRYMVVSDCPPLPPNTSSVTAINGTSTTGTNSAFGITARPLPESRQTGSFLHKSTASPQGQAM